MARRAFIKALAYVAIAIASCRTSKDTRPLVAPPPADIQPTVIDYVDTDGFDGLLESALTNQDPVITIRTTHKKPDWDGRLNAWIAAWNRGGKVEGDRPRTVRLQSPLPSVSVDGETIREFRYLVDGLMSRVDSLARQSAGWYAEERIQSRRIGLLKPYNLRLHMDDQGHIEIILFNGKYSHMYRDYVEAIAHPESEHMDRWHRGISCSVCKTSKPPRVEPDSADFRPIP